MSCSWVNICRLKPHRPAPAAAFAFLPIRPQGQNLHKCDYGAITGWMFPLINMWWNNWKSSLTSQSPHTQQPSPRWTRLRNHRGSWRNKVTGFWRITASLSHVSWRFMTVLASNPLGSVRFAYELEKCFPFLGGGGENWCRPSIIQKEVHFNWLCT